MKHIPIGVGFSQMGFSKLFSGGSHATLKSLDQSLAVIQFDLFGNILDANDNFLKTMGYTLDEIKGRHHRLFVDPAFADSAAYKDFWQRLREGHADSSEYKRFAKGGREVWIQASYNPVRASDGRPVKIVKYAADITRQKMASAEYASQIEAIGKAQAIIHFNLDGSIIDANENFLKTVGYSLDEIKGRHHSMFVGEEHARSHEYHQFWENLRRGQFEAREYRRFGKDGREIWINASYNPIFDLSGRPFKVVKFATDITQQKLESADRHGQIEAIGKAQAVIHFNLDGTIIDANENFLKTLGYDLSEIKGKHHRMFVDPAYAASREYDEFWARLRSGQFEQREYKRLAKGGREVWIQASYNPIFDMNGRPFKVVKFATDVTEKAATRIEVGNQVGLALTNVQGLAASAEQMSASISEISKNMTLSKTAVEDINNRALGAGAAAQQLLDSSRAMEQIVKLIRDIAEQVNLLALNATIEAARAGEAGKGFAVVASEVKNLAKQTSQATDNINQQIMAIQDVSEKVAGSVQSVNAAAGSVSEYVSGVASAIEEQSAVTSEISASTQRVADFIGAINTQVQKLAQ